VDVDLRRAGEDQVLMHRSDRCGQRAERRGTPGEWMLTLKSRRRPVSHAPIRQMRAESWSTSQAEEVEEQEKISVS